ncbi:Detected protein of unknown function [Hibiscus syriacus]|uniref:Uncharacterized protein n=1 Tax=Hibiscus syriacus TaxID=106335 RepID=A0A6A2ZXN7_HIBSY|nr:Detected protein of unknown function [Hibiscus syriacus]
MMAYCFPGMNYTSKLDEFENFVERVSKYGLISSSFNGNSKSSIILVIDDLPVTNGRSAFDILQRCLVLPVRSTRIPTAILITDYGNEDSSDLTAKWMEELQLSLESAGASKVMLTRKLELCNVVVEESDLIANASGVLDFASDEAMDDAWTVASYLGSFSINEKKIVGMMQKEMLRQRFTADGGSSSISEASVKGTEYRPVLKWADYTKAGDIETRTMIACKE